jgi:hypothetical protein
VLETGTISIHEIIENEENGWELVVEEKLI